MPRHDLAIYAPGASTFYDAAAASNSGGAERQTVLLARALARRGLRVAHIVHPVADPRPMADAPVTLIEQAKPESHGSLRDLAAKSRQVWSGLEAADAAVQVFRGANGTIGVGGLWARRHGRRLVFAGANDSDFTLAGFTGPRDPRAAFFRGGMRVVDAVVVQSADQERLARERFPRLTDVEQVNSFVEESPAATGPGEAFLWVSRLVDYKRPMLYADLAEAVPEARFWMIPTWTLDDGHDDALAELQARAATIDNLEVLDQRSHSELQELIGRAVAMVNTSSFEGMPNTWLEGWARGVPALTLSFDPDDRIAAHDLGVAAGGSWEDFVGATRRLWERRSDRDGRGDTVRAYVADVHGRQVSDRWAALIDRLL